MLGLCLILCFGRHFLIFVNSQYKKILYHIISPSFISRYYSYSLISHITSAFIHILPIIIGTNTITNIYGYISIANICEFNTSISIKFQGQKDFTALCVWVCLCSWCMHAHTYTCLCTNEYAHVYKCVHGCTYAHLLLTNHGLS